VDVNVGQLVLDLGREEAKQQVAPEDRILVDMSANVLGDESFGMGFCYSGFAIVHLPHRKVEDETVWERANGRALITLEPGLVPVAGRNVKFGVPYGAHARMIMIYLQTQAVKQRTREIRLGKSLNAWMRNMGISLGGNSAKRVRDQAMRISACRLTFSWMDEEGGQGFERANIVSAFATPGTSQAWDEFAVLSSDFYDALIERPIPCRDVALRQLSGSSAAIDCYVWLAYRLHALRRPTLIPWPALAAQFGSAYNRMRNFRPNFEKALARAVACYPEAKVDIEDNGLRLFPSPAPIDKRIYAISSNGA
jgi:hypothetical protein